MANVVSHSLYNGNNSDVIGSRAALRLPWPQITAPDKKGGEASPGSGVLNVSVLLIKRGRNFIALLPRHLSAPILSD